MLDLFPLVRATLKAHAYFATTLGGFKDSDGNFKVFKLNESPSAETIFITVEIRWGGKHRLTGWMTPTVLSTVYGKPTDWAALYAIAGKIDEIIGGTTVTAVVNGQKVRYEAVGDAVYDEGEDPVTGNVTVSVAQQLGFDA